MDNETFTVVILRPDMPEDARPEDVAREYELEAPSMMGALAIAKERLNPGEELAAVLDPQGGGLIRRDDASGWDVWLVAPDDAPSSTPIAPESADVESHALAMDPRFRAMVDDLKDRLARGEDI
jgi:hypothetical protein